MALDDEIIDDEEGEELNIPAIIIAAVVALALIGGGVWYFFIRIPPDESAEAKIPQWSAPEDVQEELIFSGLPELIVNPQDSRGRFYLIVKVDVALNEDIRSQFLNKLWVIPKAQEAIIDVFNSYTIDELRTPKIKEEARLQLKEELSAVLGWTGDPNMPSPDGTLPPIKDVYIVKYIFN